ncbi:MAG: phosphate acyltransferase [Anaerovoracaceae bacterium]
MIKSFKELIEHAQKMKDKTRIAVAFAHDYHTLEAISEARKCGIAEAYLIGNKEKTLDILKELSEDPENYTIIECNDVNESVAVAARLVNEGKAGAIMKGKMQTGEIMHGVLNRDNGLRTDRSLSVTGLFETPGYHKMFAITDVAITPHPDLAAKKAILLNALDLLHALGLEEPKVAAIAAAETVSPKLQETVDADKLKQMYLSGEITGCVVEGPISLDLATEKEAVEVKGYVSPVAADADLFLMPDLVSGNVFAKCVTGMAGGRTGGIVLGAKVPVILVSRAARAEEKLNAIALATVAAPYFAELNK